MCRNIKPLFNFDPPATEEEIAAAALQFVRKISGFTHPSQANAATFQRAVSQISAAAQQMLGEMQTHATPKNREIEAEKAKRRAAKRFGPV